MLQRVPSRYVNGKDSDQKLASKSIGAPASGDSPVIRRFIDVSRKILSCLISSITICILSLLSMSTSGRPPALRARAKHPRHALLRRRSAHKTHAVADYPSDAPGRPPPRHQKTTPPPCKTPTLPGAISSMESRSAPTGLSSHSARRAPLAVLRHASGHHNSQRKTPPPGRRATKPR